MKTTLAYSMREYDLKRCRKMLESAIKDANIIK
jgi:hypothetical protein